MSSAYALPGDIAAVSHPLSDLALCEARLMDDVALRPGWCWFRAGRGRAKIEAPAARPNRCG